MIRRGPNFFREKTKKKRKGEGKRRSSRMESMEICMYIWKIMEEESFFVENGENGRTSVQFFRRSVTSAGIRRNALCNRMQS